ncbi:caspase domain-containing protein [Kitasatospora sp. NPDC058032]|uniref:caspase family protein n=1 Tax=Kitasatospora sp. NPDC058032 TaxID=3346307 RepID=UPI0036DCD8C6
MRTVYALLVGIDRYPTEPLKGCENDIRAVEAWLTRRPGPPTRIRTLLNEQAGTAAVRQGIRNHLGRCGPGDTALLWFSGHGASRPTGDPREATGRYQALVCHDSLTEGGRALLQDTTLGPLLDGLARGGTHVVAVLDCCHAGGASRDDDPGLTTRGVEWMPWWDAEPAAGPSTQPPTGPSADTPTGARGAGGTGPEPPRHVLLAACRPQEKAHEGLIDGTHRGHFSHALLDALERLGPHTTYGQLHALAEEQVRRRTSGPQHPELRGAENRRFLHGDELTSAPFVLRSTSAGFEVNCGLAHGLRRIGAEFTLLPDAGTDASRAGRKVVVRELRPESALVDPVGSWARREDTGAAYPVTPSSLAFPPAAVTVSGDDRAAVRLVERAVAAAPLLARGGDGLPLRVVLRDGAAEVLGAGGDAPFLPLRSAADATRLADFLTHVTRWHRIRDLANPDPWLSTLLRVTVDSPSVGTCRRTGTGEIVCSYTRDGRPPQLRVLIHNDSDRTLWCTLVSLSTDYAATTDNYPGDFVVGRYRGVARANEPVCFQLPHTQPPRSGASTVDVLKVIAAENVLNTVPFQLDAWTGWSARSADPADNGPLVHLGPPSGDRVAGAAPGGHGRWGTAALVVRTEVP